MFSESSHFTITGGTFNNWNSISSASQPEDFRSIRLGDLNILSLVGEDNIVEEQVVRHRKRPGRVRRVRVVTGRREAYHARIFGSQDIFTVFMYQGERPAEWKANALERQMTSRNPHLPQLFGVTDSRSINGLVYHDQMVPLGVALSQCTSYLARTVVNHLMRYQFYHFNVYWGRLTGEWLGAPSNSRRYMEWFRIPTGQLSIELDQPAPSYKYLGTQGQSPERISTLQVLTPLGCMSQRSIIDSIEIDDLLNMLSYHYGTLWDISLHHGHVDLLAVYDGWKPGISSNKALSFREGTSSSRVTKFTWVFQDGDNIFYDPKITCVMQGGWTRIDLAKAHCTENHRDGFRRAYHFSGTSAVENSARFEMGWLAQANHFLPVDECASYYLTRGIHFWLTVWFPMDEHTLRGTFMTEAPASDLYLFLFQPRIRNSGNGLSVEIPQPEDTFFWSFCADGTERLTSQDLDDLGNPQVVIIPHIAGKQWRKEDYEIITEICRAKGLDPGSLDVATQLHLPVATLHKVPIPMPLEPHESSLDLETFPEYEFDECGDCYYVSALKREIKRRSTGTMDMTA